METVTFRVRVLYDNGKEEDYFLDSEVGSDQEAEDQLNEIIEIIQYGYSGDKSGHLTIDNNVINLSKTTKISVKRIKKAGRIV